MENQTRIELHQATTKFNWTSTNTLAPPTDLASTNFEIAKHVLYGIILVLSIVGNTTVIHIIRTRRSIRKTSYILLVFNLAICDVITPTLSIPFDWAYEDFGHKWIFGKVLCPVLWPLQTLFSTSSVLTLTMICYDRYRAVVHPFKARRVTKTHIKRCIFAIHLISLIFMVPYAVVLRQEGDECNEKWPTPVSNYRKAYTLALFLVQYGIPLVLMVALHSLALKTLFGHSTEDDLLRNPSKSAISNASILSSTSTISLQSIKRLYLTKEQNIRVTKMFVLVVTVFALSMFPNQVLWLWVDFGHGADNEHFLLISVVCRLFTYSNSVLNPVIYGFFSREFRSGKETLKRPVRREKVFDKEDILKLSTELRAVIENRSEKRGGCKQGQETGLETLETSSRS